MIDCYLYDQNFKKCIITSNIMVNTTWTILRNLFKEIEQKNYGHYKEKEMHQIDKTSARVTHITKHK